jgi:RimJ/RimL family protein N-acetyltransferase
MDSNTDVLEMQRSERVSGDFHNVGLKRLTPFDPLTINPQKIQWLWDRVRSQDYVFDDFYRGDAESFARGLLDGQSLHFLADTRAYIVVRNVRMSDNAEIHYCVWDENMQFREIVQCGYEIVNFLFSRIKVNRITAVVPFYNKNAAKFATILNFKFEGCIREAALYHDRHYDVSIYGILQHEWLKTRYRNA